MPQKCYNQGGNCTDRGEIEMVRKIDEKEILTRLAARKKYEAHYIGMVLTEQKPKDFDNEKGYVVYITDSYDEQFEIPRKTDDGHYISTMPGYAVGGTQLGGAFIA